MTQAIPPNQVGLPNYPDILKKGDMGANLVSIVKQLDAKLAEKVEKTVIKFKALYNDPKMEKIYLNTLLLDAETQFETWSFSGVQIILINSDLSHEKSELLAKKIKELSVWPNSETDSKKGT